MCKRLYSFLVMFVYRAQNIYLSSHRSALIMIICLSVGNEGRLYSMTSSTTQTTRSRYYHESKLVKLTKAKRCMSVQDKRTMNETSNEAHNRTTLRRAQAISKQLTHHKRSPRNSRGPSCYFPWLNSRLLCLLLMYNLFYQLPELRKLLAEFLEFFKHHCFGGLRTKLSICRCRFMQTTNSHGQYPGTA